MYNNLFIQQSFKNSLHAAGAVYFSQLHKFCRCGGLYLTSAGKGPDRGKLLLRKNLGHLAIKNFFF